MKRYLSVIVPLIYMVTLGILTYPRILFSAGGVYSTATKHGDPRTGVYYTNALPRGSCGQCHSGHTSRGQSYDFGLYAPNDNNFCWTTGGAGGCHSQGGKDSYRGAMKMSTAHTSGTLLWPGTREQTPSPPARSSADRGKCINCHTPHGYEAPHPHSLKPTLSQLVPNQTTVWEEILCEACHRDIENQTTKTYAHPVDTPSYAMRHQSTEGHASHNDYKWRYGYYSSLHGPPANMRHAECQDCHNVHTTSTSTHLPGSTSSNPASGALIGSTGVAVNNGPEWTTPTYKWINFDSTGYHPRGYSGIGYEYQLCFKCHSSWTAQPKAAGLGGVYSNYDQTDQSVEFNPNNSSFHWVENNIGSSKAYSGSAYANGFSYNSKMYCSDCHKDDARDTPKGPHGSSTPRLLGVQVPGSRFTDWNNTVNYRSNPNTVFCFNCHSFGATGFLKESSKNLHTNEHDEKPCQACHIAIPHGWKRARLIAYTTDPSPYNYGGSTARIISWTQSNGDYRKESCSTVGGGCHQ